MKNKFNNDIEISVPLYYNINDINDIKKFAISEVKNGNVKLYKQYLSEVLDCIDRKDIYELRQFKSNSYLLPEINYYTEILSRLELYLSQI